MVKFVDQQLTQLRNEVYRMWAMVYSQMDQARQAVLAMDRNIAQQIWVRERLVDAQDIKIDTQVEDFIALYTPVAVDLRFVLAMLKINSDLERIGDYAYSIARFVKETDVEKLDADLVGRLQLERMFGVVLEMMNELQASLMDENPAKASSVIDMDDELDRLKTASDSILMEYARTHTDELPVLMGLGSVFRKLERTGDHLTNIAEEIVFYVDAKVLRHTAMFSQKGE